MPIRPLTSDEEVKLFNKDLDPDLYSFDEEKGRAVLKAPVTSADDSAGKYWPIGDRSLRDSTNYPTWLKAAAAGAQRGGANVVDALDRMTKSKYAGFSPIAGFAPGALPALRDELRGSVKPVTSAEAAASPIGAKVGGAVGSMLPMLATVTTGNIPAIAESALQSGGGAAEEATAEGLPPEEVNNRALRAGLITGATQGALGPVGALGGPAKTLGGSLLKSSALQAGQAAVETPLQNLSAGRPAGENLTENVGTSAIVGLPFGAMHHVSAGRMNMGANEGVSDTTPGELLGRLRRATSPDEVASLQAQIKKAIPEISEDALNMTLSPGQRVTPAFVKAIHEGDPAKMSEMYGGDATAREILRLKEHGFALTDEDLNRFVGAEHPDVVAAAIRTRQAPGMAEKTKAAATSDAERKLEEATLQGTVAAAGNPVEGMQREDQAAKNAAANKLILKVVNRQTPKSPVNPPPFLSAAEAAAQGGEPPTSSVTAGQPAPTVTPEANTTIAAQAAAVESPATSKQAVLLTAPGQKASVGGMDVEVLDGGRVAINGKIYTPPPGMRARIGNTEVSYGNDGVKILNLEKQAAQGEKASTAEEVGIVKTPEAPAAAKSGAETQVTQVGNPPIIEQATTERAAPGVEESQKAANPGETVRTVPAGKAIEDRSAAFKAEEERMRGEVESEARKNAMSLEEKNRVQIEKLLAARKPGMKTSAEPAAKPSSIRSSPPTENELPASGKPAVPSNEPTPEAATSRRAAGPRGEESTASTTGGLGTPSPETAALRPQPASRVGGSRAGLVRTMSPSAAGAMGEEHTAVVPSKTSAEKAPITPVEGTDYVLQPKNGKWFIKTQDGKRAAGSGIHGYTTRAFAEAAARKLPKAESPELVSKPGTSETTTNTEQTNAIQEQSPTGLLQRQPGETNETGSERGRVEQSVQREEAAGARGGSGAVGQPNGGSGGEPSERAQGTPAGNERAAAAEADVRSKPLGEKIIDLASKLPGADKSLGIASKNPLDILRNSRLYGLVRSRVGLLRDAADKVSNNLGGLLTRFDLESSLESRKRDHDVVSNLKGFSNPDLSAAGRYIDEMREKGVSGVKLSPQQQRAVDRVTGLMRLWALDEIKRGPLIQTANGFRPKKIDPWYVYQQFKPEIYRRLKDGDNQLESQLAASMRRQGYSPEDIKTEWLRQTSQGRYDPDMLFKSLREPQGINYPSEWLAPIEDRLRAYARRSGGDLAYHNVIEKDPLAATAQNDFENGRGGIVPKSTEVIPSESASLFRNTLSDYARMFNQQTTTPERLTPLGNKLTVQTPQSIIDTIQTPSYLLRVANPVEVVQSLYHALTGWKGSERFIMRGSTARQDLRRIANANKDVISGMMATADLASKGSLNETLQRFMSVWGTKAGELVADRAMKTKDWSLVKRLGITNPESIEPAKLKDLITLAVQEQVNSSYSPADLPAWLNTGSGSPIRPLFALMRWSFGQFNRQVDTVVKPLFDSSASFGNRVLPLVYTLGAGMLSTELANYVKDKVFKAKPRDLTLAEWMRMGRPEAGRWLAGYLANANIGGAATGITSQILNGFSGLGGYAPRNMAYQIADNVAERLIQIFNSPEGFTEDNWKKLGQTLLTDNMSIARTLGREEDTTGDREKRLFQYYEQGRKKTTPSTLNNPFSTGYDLQRAKTPEEVTAAGQKLITSAMANQKMPLPSIREQTVNDPAFYQNYLPRLTGNPAAGSSALQRDTIADLGLTRLKKLYPAAISEASPRQPVLQEGELKARKR